MCGIAGVVSAAPFPGAVGDLAAMLQALDHRGPDDAGLTYWKSKAPDEALGPVMVGLGATRLSLVDLAGGAQPFRSASGSTIVFNGEIFNQRELRAELLDEGYPVRTHCDTEIVLAVLERHGVAGLSRLDGMFALAFTDGRRLVLARDPFGIKPLYYVSRPGRWWAFASEVKALLRCRHVAPALSSQGVFELAVFGYQLEDHSLFDGMAQVGPGTALEIDLASGDLHGHPVVYATFPTRPYLVPGDERDADGDRPPSLDPQLREQFIEAVGEHLLADHPVGIFLSGGLDSSVMLAAAAASGRQEIHTFTCGDRADLEDVRMARVVAEQFGSQHHEVHLDLAQFLEAVPSAVHAMEEPRPPTGGDFLAAAARQHTRAALCGEGSDELFGGYWIHRDPTAFLQATLQRYLRLYRLLAKANPHCSDTVKAVLVSLADRDEARLRHKMWLFTLSSQLANAHLVPWDRATMAHSYELRLPYLSQRLAGLVRRSPVVLEPFGTKPAVRRLAAGLLPAGLAERVSGRKKTGFPNNVEECMEGLRRVAHDVVPDDHSRSHPLGPLLPFGFSARPSTTPSKSGRAPEGGVRPRVDARPAGVLLIDMFLLIFLAHRGVVPPGLTVSTLYSKTFLHDLRDVLAQVRMDVPVDPIDVDEEDLRRQALG